MRVYLVRVTCIGFRCACRLPTAHSFASKDSVKQVWGLIARQSEWFIANEWEQHRLRPYVTSIHRASVLRKCQVSYSSESLFVSILFVTACVHFNLERFTLFLTSPAPFSQHPTEIEASQSTCSSNCWNKCQSALKSFRDDLWIQCQPYSFWTQSGVTPKLSAVSDSWIEIYQYQWPEDQRLPPTICFNPCSFPAWSFLVMIVPASSTRRIME